MKYLKVGLFVAIVAGALAGSLVAISDQVRQLEQPAVQADGSGSGANMKPSGGCGGGCGGGEGTCAADQIKEAKKVLAEACPKAEKGEPCDPKTCEDCAAAAKDKAGPLAACAAHKSTKPGEKPATACSVKSGSGACPVKPAAAKPAKAEASASSTAKAHECDGECATCEVGCEKKPAKGAERVVAGKAPVPKPSSD